MTQAFKDEIASSVIPILLGDGAPRRLARQLYRSLGVASLRLGKHRRLSEAFGFFCVFRRTVRNERLLLEQLLDIFEEFDGYLLLLLPTDKPSRDLIAKHREALAARFVISEPNDLLERLSRL